jgi:protein involved in polysaccharide export with SLBB domain
VICKVKEYQTQNITVLGGVVRPGLYKLSSEEMSLVAALMKAGGIIDEGAALITIRHADHSAEEQFEGTSDIDQMAYQNPSDLGTESVSRPGLLPSKTDKMSVDSIKGSIQHLVELLNVSDDPEMVSAKSHKKQVDLEPIVLPVKNMNIPFADVVLLDGDTIRVEKLDPEVFTVLGPVETPGVFPYPPDVDYNLMQALAFAGGLDIALNPRYVSIYRQDADGRIVTVTFCLDDKTLARASGIMIKPGDVISVEMTMDVRVRLVLREMLSIRFDYDLSE